LPRQKSTGADGHFDRVKTPATAAGLSKTIISTSVRFLYLMPAEAVAMRTPRSAGIVAKVFGASGETEPDIRIDLAIGISRRLGKRFAVRKCDNRG
jgi:hypothetical protein